MHAWNTESNARHFARPTISFVRPTPYLFARLTVLCNQRLTIWTVGLLLLEAEAEAEAEAAEVALKIDRFQNPGCDINALERLIE